MKKIHKNGIYGLSTITQGTWTTVSTKTKRECEGFILSRTFSEEDAKELLKAKKELIDLKERYDDLIHGGAT